MKDTISASFLAVLMFAAASWGQDAAPTIHDAPTAQATADASADTGDEHRRGADPAVATDSGAVRQAPARPFGFGFHDKLCYYATETYLNPALITAPVFRAGIRMANPPGKGASAYPAEWRQGAEAFGRNFGDSLAQRLSFQSARFAAGVMTHEDPRYFPSGRRSVLARSLYALEFSFVDRSDSGHRMPALSNFVGAVAGGFVGNAYLPAGFTDTTHAGQRATIQFGFVAAGNLFREFAPQMPRPVRNLLMLIAR